ncbi:histidinol-phosphate transaminase [Undibacterium sp. CY18W]|uniref:Histidinol-phosphate aminotransferase n=1 Tax=Undibacterium hunanense TaxID=2762292 RepID=A0ABR6ZY67_9BURK|nr:histidinol-phosphate transaminase [Undibacterium hunanense]MBC3920794.1 histidinol-phosphate transaminase [Undibacterium hunanense]
MSQYWSEVVHKLTPYVPGEQPKIDRLIKLNTNENPYPPSPQVLAAIQQAASADLRLYPDPGSDSLRDTIAAYHGLQAEQIFIGNSSDEVLAHTFQALLKHEQPLLCPDISYSFYPVYCGLYGISYRSIPLDADFRLNVEDYLQANGGIIFANPNAPTGCLLGLDKIEFLLQHNRDSVVVVDEAYVDFGGSTAIALINKYPNLLVIQTLSKSRSLAGLRVGFAAGHPDLIAGLNRVKNSFNCYPLDRLAVAGAIASFEDEAHFQQNCAAVIASRDRLTASLNDLGFTVLPSAANFVFARHPQHNALQLAQGLRASGIIVRHFKQERISEFLRISIGTDVECEALVSALKILLQA